MKLSRKGSCNNCMAKYQGVCNFKIPLKTRFNCRSNIVSIPLEDCYKPMTQKEYDEVKEIYREEINKLYD